MPPRDPANPNNCAICNWDREEVRICQGESEFVTAQIFTCPQCGEYLLDSSGFRPWRKKGYVFLSCAARQSWEAGQPLLVKANTFTQVVQAHENTTVQGNLIRLLAYLGKKAGRPGHSVTINLDRDFTVIDSEDGAEFTAYLNLLSSDGLVTVEYGPSAGPRVNLLLAGWNRLQSGPQVGGKPGTCFVAMWFDPSLGEAFSLGIQAAIEQDCDMKAVRIDQKEHNNQITDEIMAEIRGAQFMVADFTGHRSGVYYEAGFARGLGRDVIYCCRKDAFEDRHFDTSLINHIVWTDPADLRRKLAHRIKATILPKA